MVSWLVATELDLVSGPSITLSWPGTGFPRGQRVGGWLRTFMTHHSPHASRLRGACTPRIQAGPT